MKAKFMLTPYYLDQPVVGYEGIVEGEWEINQPAFLPEGSPQERMVALYRPLADFIAQTVAEGQLPVSMAGDCCTTLGVLAGLQRAGISPTLIWLDAHGDFNTWETTPSGFLGGMPLAMLVGRGEQTMPEGVGLTPHPEAQIILTDARDLDPGEKEAVETSQLLHFPSVAALLDAPLPNTPLYVHFDVDIVNPEALPAVNYLTPNGPSLALLRHLFRQIAQSGRLVALSVSLWNPTLDTDGRSEAVVMALVGELLAK